MRIVIKDLSLSRYVCVCFRSLDDLVDYRKVTFYAYIPYFTYGGGFAYNCNSKLVTKILLCSRRNWDMIFISSDSSQKELQLDIFN